MKYIGVLLGFLVVLSTDVGANQEIPVPLCGSNVRTILNSAGDVPYLLRLKAVRELPGQLPEHERTALTAFLRTPWDSDSSLNEVDLAAVKNDLTGRLIPMDPDGLAESLVEISSDPKVGAVWQGYCVQFFTILYGSVSIENRVMLDHALTDILSRPEDLRTGTALITIKNISKLPLSSPWNTKTVIGKARLIYSAPQALPLNKQAAFQILGLLGDPQTVSLARKILKTPSASAPEQLTSLSVIGQHGTAADLSLLDSFRKHTDIRLRTAANLNYSLLNKTGK